MRYISFIILLTFPLLFLSCDEDPIDDKEEKPSYKYETIVGNTFVHIGHLESYEHPYYSKKYIFYTFNEDESIDIEMRAGYLDGEIIDQCMGYYEYNHPVLKLKVQTDSKCENCFNTYEVKVDDYRRNFTIKYWTGFEDTFFVYDSYYDTKYKLKPKSDH